MLREARIVMPYNVKLTADANYVATKNLRRQLMEAFGGFTCFAGTGGWRNGELTITNNITSYNVAIEATRDASWDKLFQIAMKAGQELNQQAVYIRYPDGSVEIASVAAYAENGIKRVHHGFGDVSMAEAETYKPASVGVSDLTPKVPLGGRRLPAVGEIWENAIGQKVAVVARRRVIDDRLDVVVLTAGGGARFKAGVTYEVDEDGKVLIDKSSHPRDLKRFIKDF